MEYAFNYENFKKEMESRGHRVRKHLGFLKIEPDGNYLGYARGFMYAYEPIEDVEGMEWLAFVSWKHWNTEVYEEIFKIKDDINEPDDVEGISGADFREMKGSIGMEFNLIEFDNYFTGYGFSSFFECYDEEDMLEMLKDGSYTFSAGFDEPMADVDFIVLNIDKEEPMYSTIKITDVKRS